MANTAPCVGLLTALGLFSLALILQPAPDIGMEPQLHHRHGAFRSVAKGRQWGGGERNGHCHHSPSGFQFQHRGAFGVLSGEASRGGGGGGLSDRLFSRRGVAVRTSEDATPEGREVREVRTEGQ